MVSRQRITVIGRGQGSRALCADSFRERRPVAYQSNSLEMIGATLGSGAIIFLPSGPSRLRYPSGVNEGQMPCAAFSNIPLRVWAKMISPHGLEFFSWAEPTPT
jgi:hypothetical protein